MIARLQLDVARKDGRGPSPDGYPDFTAIYLVVDGVFELVTQPETLRIDPFGDQHERVEPVYELYENSGRGELLVLEDAGDGAWRRDHAGKLTTVSTMDAKTFAATGGKPIQKEVAAASALEPLRNAPTKVVYDEPSKTVISRDAWTRWPLGTLSELLPTAKAEAGISAQLCLMNEGTAARVFVPYSESAECWRILRPGAKAFTVPDEATVHVLRAAMTRRSGSVWSGSLVRPAARG